MRTAFSSRAGVHQPAKTTKTLIGFFLTLTLLTGLFFHDICRQPPANTLTTEDYSLISIQEIQREPEPEPTTETPMDWGDLTKVFTDADTNPKNSLKTFLVTQEHRELYPNDTTTCQQKLAPEEFLCKLGYKDSCYARGPADVIETFWAVGPMYAYIQSRNQMLYEFHNNFRDYIKSIGMSFCTIEGIRADLGQKYEVTTAGREPYDIQVTIYDEDYIRENLLNVALKKIPGWEYVTWIDAHQFFENMYWWEESIVIMEKYGAVQPFKMTQRMDFNNGTLMLKQGAIALSLVQSTLDEGPTIEYGNAFTIRREMYEAIGGIIDVGIASGCDLSYVTGSIPANISFGLLYTTPNYAKNFQPWIDRMREVFKGQRAIVRGTLHHLRHMKYFGYEKSAEAYDKANFNFTLDTTKDVNGTIKITNPQIRQLIPNLRFSYNPGW